MDMGITPSSDVFLRLLQNEKARQAGSAMEIPANYSDFRGRRKQKASLRLLGEARRPNERAAFGFAISGRELAMQDLTPEGLRILEDVARRHAVSLDAVVTLLRALMEGNGSQAQFNHPDLGGMGQWSQGGMIMVGDMFNQGLKHRVDTLCSELARLLGGQTLLSANAGSFQSQSQSGSGGVSWFVPGSGASSRRWWPAELGDPASTGAQNELRYACFPGPRRLAIQQGGRVSVYDTGEHRITGFSQQQSGDQSLTFTSQFGLVRVADLPLVFPNGTQPEAPATSIFATPQPSPKPISPAVAPEVAPPTAAPKPAASPAVGDILTTIERLAELRQKNVLTEEEFAAKKSELLSRL